MKGLVKTAAAALAAAGISSAVAASDRTTGAAEVSQISGGTGLSFEDLRVNLMGKVPVEIGSTKAQWQHAENCGPQPPHGPGPDPAGDPSSADRC